MTFDELKQLEERVKRARDIQARLERIKEDRVALPRMDAANTLNGNQPAIQSFSGVEIVEMYKRALQTALSELEGALRKELAET